MKACRHDSLSTWKPVEDTKINIVDKQETDHDTKSSLLPRAHDDTVDKSEFERFCHSFIFKDESRYFCWRDAEMQYVLPHTFKRANQQMFMFASVV